MRLKVGRLWLWAGVMVAAAGIAVGWSVTALAAPPFPIFGRAEFHGYFTDIRDCRGHDVIAGGIPSTYTNSGQFFAYIQSKLSSPSAWDRVGAAFIIQTMRGGVSRNSPPTLAEIVDWRDRVLYAESQGWIVWNQGFSYTVNSMYQGLPANGAGSCPQTNPTDDAYYPNVGFDSAIVFRNPATGQFYYALRHACANPIGVLPGIPGLPEPNFSLSTSIAPGSGTPGHMGIIEAGQTYRLTPSVFNAGPAASTSVAFDVNNLNPTYVSFVAATRSDPLASGGYGYTAPCNTALQCWYWWYPSIPAGRLSTQVDGAWFTTSPSTPEGTVVCFNAGVAPSTRAGGIFVSPNLCFQVYQPHYPGIIAQSGDVHAGGGLCTAATGSTGNVTTRPGSDSITEYVLSANGTVSNFGSNNTVGGSNATVGRTGSYYSVCRPDLVKVARDYFNAGGAFTPLPGGSYDLASLPASTNGVYLHNGGPDISLRGIVNRKITIVSLTGNVTISNNITVTSAATVGNNVASLGLISANDVYIMGAARQVDAYIFSDGTISTCREGDLGNTAPCLNTMSMNGFLMGRNLAFRRLGPPTGGRATVGERFNLTGQIYLNPPKFFDNTVSLNLLQSQGEKPPLN